MIEEIGKIDKAIDELLVNLGGMVLRLASPEITRTREERQALARSVNQFSTCALTSKDARVRTLAVKLEATLHHDPVPENHAPDSVSATEAPASSETESATHSEATRPEAGARSHLRLVVSR